jgi:transcriptional regulator with XRE-family HTH domain
MSTKANSARIRELRIAKGLSQEDLAEEANLGHRTIQRIEEGGLARPATLRAVASVLGVKVPEIIATGIDGEPSLADVHRAIGAKLQRLAASGKAMPATPKVKIEILEIAPASDDEDRESPIVVAIQQFLRDLGYETSQGTWSDARLLAKRRRTGADELFIIHANNSTLADRLYDTLTNLNLGLSVVILPAAEVAKRSVRIPATEVLGRQDALVAYRAG